MPFATTKALRLARLKPPTSITLPNGSQVTLDGIAEGDWIDVNADNSTGLRQRVKARSMRTEFSQSDGARVLVDMFAERIATLQEVIVNWSNPEPWNPGYVEEMQPELSDWLFTEWQKASGGLSEDEKNALRGTVTPGAAAAVSPKS